jgi:hypothetical protein
MHPAFSDPSDWIPMGAPVSSVEIDGGADVTVCFVVPRPFGPGTDVQLVIHATRGDGNDGGEITLSIDESLEPRRYHHPPKPVMNMHLLSAPPPFDTDDDEAHGV